MNILGIIGFGENPAACLLVDGKISAFAEEERFTRLKGSDGMFPSKAIVYCLSSAKLNLSDVDKIAFGWDSRKYPWGILKNFGVNYLKYKWYERKSYHRQKDLSSIFTAVGTIMEYHPSDIKSKILQGLRMAGLSGDMPGIEFIPHHLAHAYSSYFCSGFNNAGILTIDGSGEDVCTQLAVGNGENVNVVESYPIPHSIGWFYAAVTQYLGFIPYRDEGKLMGLAALGEERRNSNKWLEPLSRILKIRNSSYELDPIYTKFGGHYYADRYTDAMVKLLTNVDSNAVPISYGEKIEINGKIQSKYLQDIYIDIAWAAQEMLERVAIMLARKLVSEYGVENICIAGGVGLNCKMNGEIYRKSGCKNIFVQPASSDCGSALGAAMYVAKGMGENVRNTMKHVYYGPGFSNDEIYNVLKNCKISFNETDNPAEDAAKLLEEGKLVAWFQDRMEFGSRALGARSILANPTISGAKEKVNSEVKYREGWRPFCPSMIEEVKQDYLEDPNEASFMIVAYHAKDSMKQALPSVVHVDGTVRPQVIASDVNPLFHRLISSLGKKSGHPVVMNTSFNVRGEPIVCTPLDAIRCFYSNGLDALVIGNFILKKG